MSVKKQIKKATQATKTTVDTTYKSGSYAEQNAKVDATTNQNINNATKHVESAYQQATANNAQRAAQSHATNAVTTKQIGTRMRNEGYSLTNRNVAGAVAARNASTINTARTNANRNAAITRDTTQNAAKQSAYTLAAKAKSSNIERDIARSTQLNKTSAEQSYQHAEAAKQRKLKNAIQKREDNLAKKKRKYEKKQRQLKSYTETLSTRYQSVKSINKAIKKMKKNKKASYQKTKIAYLQALRAQLKQEKKNNSGGGGGRSGGRRYGGYGRRSYGSRSSSSSNSSLPTLGNSSNNNGKTLNGNSKAKVAYQKKITQLWSNRGRTLVQPSTKKQDKKAAATKKKQKGGTATSVRWRGSTIRNAASRKK